MLLCFMDRVAHLIRFGEDAAEGLAWGKATLSSPNAMNTSHSMLESSRDGRDRERAHSAEVVSALLVVHNGSVDFFIS